MCITISLSGSLLAKKKRTGKTLQTSSQVRCYGLTPEKLTAGTHGTSKNKWAGYFVR